MANSVQRLTGSVLCYLALMLAGHPCAGQVFDAGELINLDGEFPAIDTYNEFFPGSIYELRPAHVRLSEPRENASERSSRRYFPFFEPPPATPPQEQVRLTDQDLLTLVYPSHGGSFSSLGEARFQRLRIGGRDIVLELFRIPLNVYGDTVVQQQEAGLFLGQLSPGVYDVTIRNWFLPQEVLPGFDPESFEPSPDMAPPVVSVSAFQFTVLAVPEPSSLVLALTALMVLARRTRRDACRHTSLLS